MKNTHQLSALFLLALVVSLPFYSANVLASVQVTHNAGSDQIDGFVDGQGDIWTLKALLSQIEGPITPEQVIVKVGSEEDAFSSCRETATGTECEYVSSLSSGIPEGDYNFEVIYAPQDDQRASDILSADGSAPQVSEFTLDQRDGKLELRATIAEEQTGTAVGIKQIDVLDALTSQILYTKDDFSLGQSTFELETELTLSGEGRKVIALEVTDWLGHTQRVRQSKVVDFVAPEPLSINYTSLGDFVPTHEITSDISVIVKESSSLSSNNVRLSSPHSSDLDNTQAQSCSPLEDSNDLWECTWTAIRLRGQESMQATLQLSDQKGNTNERTFTTTFVVDQSAPVVEFFGTSRVFEGVSYLGNNIQNEIVLLVDEVGSGMDAQDIRANLASLGKGSSVVPDTCDQAGNRLTCKWEVNTRANHGEAKRIGLDVLKDNVGNLGPNAETDVIFDTNVPQLVDFSARPLRASQGSSFLQGGDVLELTLEVSEPTGLAISMDLTDIVNDAEELYPQTDTHPAGWLYLTQNDACTRNSQGNWQCIVETPPIRSGFVRNAQFTLQIIDTAGNEVENYIGDQLVEHTRNGLYSFELLHLEDELSPDYWETSAAQAIGFVDLDTTHLVRTKIPVEIDLSSPEGQISLLEAQAVGVCQTNETNAPQIARSYLLSSSFTQESGEDPTLAYYLEYEPFQGESFFNLEEELAFQDQIEIEYTCAFNLLTRVGNSVTAGAELQEVTFSVPFGFSKLGALDENIDQKIKNLKERGVQKIGGLLQALNTVVQIADLIANVVNVVRDILTIFQLVKGSATGLYTASVTLPAGQALCSGADAGQQIGEKFFDSVQIPLGILSCKDTGNKLGWYGDYQNHILEYYNVWSGRGPLGLGATSLRENIYTSSLGLCLPGIIENLEELRQVQCREILCYQNDIPAGVATPASCAALGDYLTCQYFKGSLTELIPGIGAIEAVLDFLKGLVSSPAGLIRTGVLAATCLPACFAGSTGGAASTVCSAGAVITKAGDLVDSIGGIAQQFQNQNVVANHYCSKVE